MPAAARLSTHIATRIAALVAAGVLGAAPLAPARGQSARLDDSASPRAHVNADFRQARMLDANTFVLPVGRVEYRLATAPYLGRRVRIYHVIPPAIAGLRSPAGLQVQWRGSGSFQSGAGRPGERVLVWSGVVQAPWINETLDLQWQFDPRLLQLPPGGALSVETYFEIETQP